MAPPIIRLRAIVPSDPYRCRRCFVALFGMCLGFLVLDRPAMAQSPVANYDETKVGLYTLPDPLMGSDGERVTTAEAWNTRRRPEIMRLFETYMYGQVPTPTHPIKPKFTVCSEDREALGGKAIRREVAIRFGDDPAGPVIHLLLYLPKNAAADRRVPAFLGLNFEGNHAVSTDPGIALWTSRTITSRSRKSFAGPQLLIRSSGRAYCQCSGLPLPTPDLSIHQFNRRIPGFQGLQLVRLLRPLERCQEGQDGVRVDGLDQMVVEARLA